MDSFYTPGTGHPFFSGQETLYWTCTSDEFTDEDITDDGLYDINGDNISKFTHVINITSEQTPFSIQPFARLNFLVDYAEIDADFGYDDVLNINIEQSLYAIENLYYKKKR